MYLSTKEVAVILDRTKSGVLYLVKKGELSPLNNQKEFFIFDEDDVLTFKNTRNGK